MTKHVYIHFQISDLNPGQMFVNSCELNCNEFTEGYPVYSRVFFCPACTRIWGSVTIEGSDYSRPEMVACTICKWSSLCSPVPGSLISYGIPPSGMDIGLLEILPDELLKREFSLTLAAWDRIQS